MLYYNQIPSAMTLFYLGDPCYVLDDDAYYEALDLYYDDPFAPSYVLKDGREIKFTATDFGDAGGSDRDGFGYSCDSGLLGILRADQIDRSKKDDVANILALSGCRFVELPAATVTEAVMQGQSPLLFDLPDDEDVTEIVTVWEDGEV